MKAGRSIAAYGTGLETFSTRNWYLAVTESLTSLAAFDIARKFLEQGWGGAGYSFLLEAPDKSGDREMLLAAGALEEGSAFMEAREQETGAITGKGSVTIEAARGRAVKCYRRALELDPSFHEARLRLGHVLLEQARAREASGVLEKVFAEGSERRQRYLAALFLGGAYERELVPDRAITWYRAALAIEPSAQAARVALASALEREGDLRSVQETLLPFAWRRRYDSAPDPWAEYPLGRIDEARRALAALRDMVVRR
jgi:tetratricopeptide (TPR) repeat protein